MNKRRLLSRLMATTALFGGVAYADGAEAPALFVTAASQSPATPITSLSDMPVVAPVARPGATIISALDDRNVPAALENTLFDEMDFGESDAEDVMAPSVDEPVTQLPPPTAEPPAPVPSSELNEDEILFEADYVSRATEDSAIIAQGNVRAYFGERYLIADALSYDPKTDIVIANGHVSITDANMETAFAGRVELTGDLRDGIAENFSALLAQNAKLAADTAVEEQGARTRLTKAIYTACDVCKKNGDEKSPTWAMRALRVTRDRERRVVQFHHAFFEIKGVPVFYLPFVQAPDPSVERQSGFLTPVVGASSRLGFNLELPYYFAISNHQDATFYPKYTSNDGVLWQGEYRRKDISGEHAIQAGVIDFDNADPTESAGVPGVRWHVFAKGKRDFGENWSAGYDVERVSDNTYLRRYSIRRRGELRQQIDTSRSNRLRSNAYMRWASGDSELTFNSYLFQGLRSSDDSALTPYVLPLINYHHDLGDKIAGGRAHLNANFASLQRTSGADSQRFTASAYWEREEITPGGHKFNAFAELRGDAFYYHDLNEGTETISAGEINDDNQFEARFAPTAGIEWAYPLTKHTNSARFLIEPRVQLVASPANRNPSSILNEDSQSTEFDFASLYEYNKSTGYDAFEDGQRINAGVAASAVFDNGITIEGSIGEQFRLQSSDAFFTSTGLGEKRSDIVGSLNLKYKTIFGIENRFRIDDDSGSIQRAESLAYLRYWRFAGSVTYVRLNEENTKAALVRREELTGNMRVRLTNHWSAGFGVRQDLYRNRTIRQDFAIGYSDECTSLDIIFRNDRTRDVGLNTDTSFLIRFTLHSLVD